MNILTRWQRKVPFYGLVLLAIGCAVTPAAMADDAPVLTLILKDHHFMPDRLTAPAHVKFKLMVQNTDDTDDEFESRELNREKLVPHGQTIPFFLGPLEPGEYPFFGDFHQDTARGVLVAQ